MAGGVVIEIDAQELVALGDRLIAVGEKGQARLVQGMAEIRVKAQVIAVNRMRVATPVVSGRLANSTEAEVESEGTSLTIQVRQPATSDDGVEYAPIVIGGRGPVLPVNKKALAGPNFGPVHSAGPAAPNPYPDQAMPQIEAGVDAMLSAEGRKILLTMLLGVGG